jgi:hypothetical protein
MSVRKVINSLVSKYADFSQWGNPTNTNTECSVKTTAAPFTVTTGSPGIINFTGHKLQSGERVRFQTNDTLPAGLDSVTQYYADVIDANTFYVKATKNGARVAITTTGTGIHWFATCDYFRVLATGASANNVTSRTVGLVAGQKYAVSCSVKDVVGTMQEVIYWGQNLGAGVYPKATAAAGYVGLIGFVFTAVTTDAGALLRIGINPLSGGAASGCAVTISDIQVELIPAGQTAPSEYVPPSVNGCFDYALAHTLASTHGTITDYKFGAITETRGADLVVPRGSSVLVMGDSFTSNNDSWPAVVNANNADIGVVLNAMPGRTLATAMGDFEKNMTLNNVGVYFDSTYQYVFNTMPDRALRPSILIQTNIVNDVIAGTSEAAIKALYERLITMAESRGVGLIIANVPPFKNHPSSTAPKQAVATEINAWLPTRAAQAKFVKVWDQYSVLNDPADIGDILPVYEFTGDGLHLHPNAAGGIALADSVETVIEQLQIIMRNTAVVNSGGLLSSLTSSLLG